MAQPEYKCVSCSHCPLASTTCRQGAGARPKRCPKAVAVAAVKQLWGTQNEPAALPRPTNGLASYSWGLSVPPAVCLCPSRELRGGMRVWQKSGYPALGSTLGRVSVSVLGRPHHSDQLQGCSVLAAQPCLSALEITPSLCFPGRWCRSTPGWAAGLPSASPSLGKWVLGPGLWRRGQQSWQRAPSAFAHAWVLPACPDGVS